MQELSVHFSSKPFSSLLLEAKAVDRIYSYLRSRDIDVDSLYAYNILYLKSCEISIDSDFNNDPIDACIAIFNIEHKINHDYYSRIEVENRRLRIDLERQHKEFSDPLVIPSRPDFLRKEIILYYYFKFDSVVEVK